MPEPESRIARLEERLKALEERLSQHEIVQQREIHQATDTADHSRVEMERRLDEMNNLRRQIESERVQFITRDRLDASVKALEDRIDDTKSALAVIERKFANQEGRFWAMGVAFSVAVVILNIVIRFMWK